MSLSNELYFTLGAWVLTALIGLAIEIRHPDGNTKSRRRLLLFQFIAIAVFAAISTISSYYSGKTQNQIKDTVNYTSDLSREIVKLQNINNEIGNRIEILSQKNNEIVERNVSLSKESQLLIKEVQTLTNRSKELIASIDKRTMEEAEMNAQTGRLEMSFNREVSNQDRVMVTFGNNTGWNTVQEIKNGAKPFLVEDTDPLSIRFDNKNNLIFDLKVFDLDGNLVAEIVDNYWRPNKNFVGKFNYDDKGFEVIDNKDNIAISVDITGSNKITIQGMFVIKEAKAIWIHGMGGTTNFPMKNHSITSYYIGNKDYNIALDEAIKKVKMKRIFKYTGDKWLHIRL